MAVSSDVVLGIFLIVLAMIVVVGLAGYSLIQVLFYGRKRYVLQKTPSKGADSVLTGANLSRDMTVTQATMTGVGAMIGAGIFVLTGIAAGIAGPGLL
ncbi:MAG: hypothetical protein ACXABU_10880, partial [Candidatus Hodarchaeales archaeon]